MKSVGLPGENPAAVRHPMCIHHARGADYFINQAIAITQTVIANRETAGRDRMFRNRDRVMNLLRLARAQHARCYHECHLGDW